jgi:hypothetical protein
MTQDQRQELIDLSWRYAVLIGITDHEGVVSKEVAEADRKRWAGLIKKAPSGRPAFIDDDAIAFMQELSGMSYDDCREVLIEEWKKLEE